MILEWAVRRVSPQSEDHREEFSARPEPFGHFPVVVGHRHFHSGRCAHRRRGEGYCCCWTLRRCRWYPGPGRVMMTHIDAQRRSPASRRWRLSRLALPTTGPSVKSASAKASVPLTDNSRSAATTSTASPPLRAACHQIESCVRHRRQQHLNVSIRGQGHGQRQKIRIRLLPGPYRAGDPADARRDQGQQEGQGRGRAYRPRSTLPPTRTSSLDRQLSEYGDKLPADKKAIIETAAHQQAGRREAHKNFDVAAIDTAMTDSTPPHGRPLHQDLQLPSSRRRHWQPVLTPASSPDPNAGSQQGNNDGQPEDVEFEEIK